MMNPYKLVFSLYLDDVRPVVPIFKAKEFFFKNDFNLWIEEFFNTRDYNKGKITGRRKKILNILCEISENKTILFDCDKIIEMIEGNKEIVEKHFWIVQSVEKYVNKIEENEFDFNKMYDVNQSKKIYFGLKKFFDVCEYDPFSFTDKELSNEEKMKFLHDIL
jgi:hypothetical protein